MEDDLKGWKAGGKRAKELLSLLEPVNDSIYRGGVHMYLTLYHLKDSGHGDYAGNGVWGMAIYRQVLKQYRRLMVDCSLGYGFHIAELDLEVAKKSSADRIQRLIESIKEWKANPDTDEYEELERELKVQAWKEDAYREYRDYLDLDEVDDPKACKCLKSFLKWSGPEIYSNEDCCYLENLSAYPKPDNTPGISGDQFRVLAAWKSPKKLVELLASAGDDLSRTLVQKALDGEDFSGARSFLYQSFQEG